MPPKSRKYSAAREQAAILRKRARSVSVSSVSTDPDLRSDPDAGSDSGSDGDNGNNNRKGQTQQRTIKSKSKAKRKPDLNSDSSDSSGFDSDSAFNFHLKQLSSKSKKKGKASSGTRARIPRTTAKRNVTKPPVKRMKLSASDTHAATTTAAAVTPDLRHAKWAHSEESHPFGTAKWWKEIAAKDLFWSDLKKKVPKGILAKRLVVGIILDVSSTPNSGAGLEGIGNGGSYIESLGEDEGTRTRVVQNVSALASNSAKTRFGLTESDDDDDDDDSDGDDGKQEAVKGGTCDKTKVSIQKTAAVTTKVSVRPTADNVSSGEETCSDDDDDGEIAEIFGEESTKTKRLLNGRETISKQELAKFPESQVVPTIKGANGGRVSKIKQPAQLSVMSENDDDYEKANIVKTEGKKERKAATAKKMSVPQKTKDERIVHVKDTSIDKCSDRSIANEETSNRRPKSGSTKTAKPRTSVEEEAGGIDSQKLCVMVPSLQNASTRGSGQAGSKEKVSSRDSPVIGNMENADSDSSDTIVVLAPFKDAL